MRTLGARIGRRVAEGVVGIGDGVEKTVLCPAQWLQGTVIVDAADDGSSRDGEDTLMVIWTDGSRTQDGRVGAAAVHLVEGEWRTCRRHLGTNKEVFDAEMYALGLALQEAQRYTTGWGYTEVEIRCDAQAALQRIKHNRPGPGQWLAQRVIDLEAELLEAGMKVTFRWVKGHKGLEGNERADEAAKQATDPRTRRIHYEASFASLAHINRVTTERKWEESKEWLVAQCRGNRTYRLVTTQRRDKPPLGAPKRQAARYYQLKMGHALIGTYLKRIGKSADDKCWWCGRKARQTREHLFKDCRRWRRQQAAMWGGLGKEKDEDGNLDGLHKNASIPTLFAHPKAAGYIMDFLRTTEVGRRVGESWREQNREEQADLWGWQGEAVGGRGGLREGVEAGARELGGEAERGGEVGRSGEG
jgi:ribonuclease HI